VKASEISPEDITSSGRTSIAAVESRMVLCSGRDGGSRIDPPKEHLIHHIFDLLDIPDVPSNQTVSEVLLSTCLLALAE